MFCVVMVRDVQPEIRPEVTRKVRKSFANPPSLRLPAWQAADYPPRPPVGRTRPVARRAGSGCNGFGAVAAATRFRRSRELTLEDERRFVPLAR